jgi:hypothetical protein
MFSSENRQILGEIAVWRYNYGAAAIKDADFIACPPMTDSCKRTRIAEVA